MLILKNSYKYKPTFFNGAKFSDFICYQMTLLLYSKIFEPADGMES